jgi:hypothetical protein
VLSSELTSKGLVLVKMGKAKPKVCYRLFSNEKYMWLTTGIDQIFRYDGKAWKELVCPENT